MFNNLKIINKEKLNWIIPLTVMLVWSIATFINMMPITFCGDEVHA